MIDPDLTADLSCPVSNAEAWDEAILQLHLRLKKLMTALCTGKFPSDEHNMDSADISALLRQVLAMYSDYNSLQTQVDYFVLNLNRPLLYAVVADILLRSVEPLLRKVG